MSRIVFHKLQQPESKRRLASFGTTNSRLHFVGKTLLVADRLCLFLILPSRSAPSIGLFQTKGKKTSAILGYLNDLHEKHLPNLHPASILLLVLIVRRMACAGQMLRGLGSPRLKEKAHRHLPHTAMANLLLPILVHLKHFMMISRWTKKTLTTLDHIKLYHWLDQPEQIHLR